MEIDLSPPRGIKRRVRNKSADCERATRLDKYYTSREVAAHCLAMFEPYLAPDTLLIEPSAGSGSFIDVTTRRIIGFDIDPDSSQVIAHDFLTLPITPRDNVALIGNPPFGLKGKLAAEFVNRGLEMAGLVGFILPITYRRWEQQKRINPAARLVLDQELPRRSYTFCKRAVDIPCSFQVWTLRKKWPDLRLKCDPPRKHPDFDTWRCNLSDNPRHAQQDWDFAVARTGSYDFSIKVWNGIGELNQKQEYTLFKAHSPAALRRLTQINFAALSLLSGMKPNVSNFDVVTAYNAILDKEFLTMIYDADTYTLNNPLDHFITLAIDAANRMVSVTRAIKDGFPELRVIDNESFRLWTVETMAKLADRYPRSDPLSRGSEDLGQVLYWGPDGPHGFDFRDGILVDGKRQTIRSNAIIIAAAKAGEFVNADPRAYPVEWIDSEQGSPMDGNHRSHAMRSALRG